MVYQRPWHNDKTAQPVERACEFTNIACNTTCMQYSMPMNKMQEDSKHLIYLCRLLQYANQRIVYYSALAAAGCWPQPASIRAVPIHKKHPQTAVRPDLGVLCRRRQRVLWAYSSHMRPRWIHMARWARSPSLERMASTRRRCSRRLSAARPGWTSTAMWER